MNSMENMKEFFSAAATENTDNHFVEGVVSPEQADFLHRLVDLGTSFMDGKHRDGLVLKYADNETLKQLVAEPLPVKGSSFDGLLQDIEQKILPYSIAQSDKRFLAFPDTGNSLATLAADVLAPFTNQNMIAVDRSAPVATFVEIQTLLWLRELIGYSAPSMKDLKSLDQVGGMWTPGGNLSNYMSVLGALHKRFPEVRKGGLWSLKKRPVIVVARGIDHFSFANAAVALGLGSDGILWAEANGAYQTDTNSLRKVLDNCPADVEPFMVVSVAGNCRTTSIDNLQEIRSICDERGLWMHADGCHGGSLLFSPKLKQEMLPGIELADSISLDPHKGLFLTYPASYVLFKDPTALAALSRYPEKTKEPGQFDLGLITPFLGSRGFQSLKLWMLMKHLGIDGLSKAIEARQETNRTLTNVLKDSELFVLLNESQFYRQAFVFCPKPVHEFLQTEELSPEQQKVARNLINRYSNKFNNALYQSGEIVFDAYQMNDLGDLLKLGRDDKFSVLSMSIGHAHIAPEIVGSIEHRLRTVGAGFAKDMIKDFADLDIHVGAPHRPADEGAEPAKPQGPAGW